MNIDVLTFHYSQVLYTHVTFTDDLITQTSCTCLAAGCFCFALGTEKTNTFLKITTYKNNLLIKLTWQIQ